MENEISQDQPQKKEETELLDLLKDRNIKWRCLGADCPDSCCFMFQEAVIFINEIPRLSQYFPLSFNILNLPDGKTESSLSIFLKTPLETSSSCVYLRKGEGCILGEERPLVCKQRPFCMVKDLEGQYKVAIKPSCPGFSVESGPPILMPDGAINSHIYLDCVIPALSVAEMAEETHEFVQTLLKYDLIAAGCCEHRGQKVYMHLIDTQKVLALPRDVHDSFQAKGYIDLILAHVKSIVQMRRFIDSYLDSNK